MSEQKSSSGLSWEGWLVMDRRFFRVTAGKVAAICRHRRASLEGMEVRFVPLVFGG